MKKTIIALAMLYMVFAVTQFEAQDARTTHVLGTPPVEAQVRKLWDAFQKKGNARLVA
jgi:hypothetical protein